MSAADQMFHGPVLGIGPVLSFEGASYAELYDDFKNAIDDYLADCAEQNIEPAKPYSGDLRVRMDSDLHRQVAASARSAGLSVNKWIIGVVESNVGRRGGEDPQHQLQRAQ